ICCKRSIRLSIGGCVAHQFLPFFLRDFLPSGKAIYMDAVAFWAFFTSLSSSLILVKELINPVGFRVNSTADASAKYSRFLETASWRNCVEICARVIMTR